MSSFVLRSWPLPSLCWQLSSPQYPQPFVDRDVSSCLRGCGGVSLVQQLLLRVADLDLVVMKELVATTQ